MMPKKTNQGLLLASAAAALFAAGCAQTGTTSAGGAQEAKVKCAGVNACKGQSTCATATTSCKGHNACKGQGWLYKTKEECKKEGGTII